MEFQAIQAMNSFQPYSQENSFPEENEYEYPLEEGVASYDSLDDPAVIDRELGFV